MTFKKSISHGAQYVTTLWKKYFSHPSLVIYFFQHPIDKKLKLRLQIGKRLLIATHSTIGTIYPNQQRVSGIAVPFTRLSTSFVKLLGQNHFAQSNRACVF
jgi:hypothetical protein